MILTLIINKNIAQTADRVHSRVVLRSSASGVVVPLSPVMALKTVILYTLLVLLATKFPEVKNGTQSRKGDSQRCNDESTTHQNCSCETNSSLYRTHTKTTSSKPTKSLIDTRSSLHISGPQDPRPSSISSNDSSSTIVPPETTSLHMSYSRSATYQGPHPSSISSNDDEINSSPTMAPPEITTRAKSTVKTASISSDINKAYDKVGTLLSVLLSVM